MNFIISFIVASVFIFGAKSFIKKYRNILYVVFTGISISVALISYFNLSTIMPDFIRSWILPIFSKSAFATSLFVYVMYANAVPKGNIVMKTVMPIRAELSIIASILTLGHNVYYGISYFPTLFVNPLSMPAKYMWASICSLVMILIMIPLFITSFPKYRRIIEPKKWKKLQRLAYIFYGLIYVHVLILSLPTAIKGVTSVRINILIYSLVFITYGVMRVGKAIQNKSTVIKIIPKVVGGCMILTLSWIILETGNMSTQTNLNKAGQETMAEESVLTEDAAQEYNDGIYSGSALGYNDVINVDVTIEKGKIANIEITQHSDDESYFESCRAVITKIIDSQSTEVDAVSGATCSSLGIIDAVKEALDSAIIKSSYSI